MLCELCPAECGLEDQCEDVFREAGAIPEPPEFGMGFKSNQVCSEVMTPLKKKKNSQSKQILLLFLHLLEEDLGGVSTLHFCLGCRNVV